MRNKNKASEKYKELLSRKDISLIIGDINDNAVEFDNAYDYIIHAASGANAESFANDPIGVFNANVIGTEKLLNNIDKFGCTSMVFVSSFTVYGCDTKEVPVIDEMYRGRDDWNLDSSCYAYGKKAAELLCVAATKKYGYPIKIVRPGFVYGDSSPMDNRVYAEIIRNLAEMKNISMKSSGMLFRSMVYVTDVVRGIFVTLLKGKNGEAYNIANEFVSIRDFAEIASSTDDSGIVKVVFNNPKDYEVNLNITNGGEMSIDKLKACGWQPKVSLLDGIKMSVESYRKKYL